jgi:hypothetical protein
MRDRGFCGVIVAVTGNAMPDEIHHFLTEGADLVVTSKQIKCNAMQYYCPFLCLFLWVL